MSNSKTTPQFFLVHSDFKEIVSENWFDKDFWMTQNKLTGIANAGRGDTYFFKYDIQKFVLRHYRRGGLMAKISKDNYFFVGKNNTRSFAEFHLHTILFDNHLPVAKPIAARFIKKGLFYTADYISQKIPNAETLHQYLKYNKSNKIMPKVYQMIDKFHDFGLNHTDLNIDNILISDEKLYLLDFDKCDLHATKKTKKENLARLTRSLKKNHL